MSVYNPCQLPEVEKVDILVLGPRPFGQSPPEPALGPFPITAVVAAPIEAVQEIASLWRSLPPGEQARCHVPPFGLRFFADGTVIVEASLCWSCNNIWLLEHGEPHVYKFDARAEVSQQLYRLLKSLTEQP